MTLSWWFKIKKDVPRELVKTPLEDVPSAGIFTLRRSLPSGSAVNSVICTVAELIKSVSNVEYHASTVQIFVPSEGGFCKDFRMDDIASESEHEACTCFWCVRPEIAK